MAKEKYRVPAPTKQFFALWDLTLFHKNKASGKSSEKPTPIFVSLGEVLLNPEDGCLIRIRRNLRVDGLARLMQKFDPFQTCDGAMNYARIWGRRAAYLCDIYGGGNPSDHKTHIWYKIDHASGKKEIKKIHPPYKENLTFSEADKIVPSRKFEFDGLFADLIEALKAEGFTIVE